MLNSLQQKRVNTLKRRMAHLLERIKNTPAEKVPNGNWDKAELAALRFALDVIQLADYYDIIGHYDGTS